MSSQRQFRRKFLEWVRRYLPCEIVGTVAELGAAAAVYLATGSWAATAVAATVFATVGYYAIAYINAVRWTMPTQSHRARPMAFVVSNALALRSVAVEFGPAEAVDSLVVRPAAYYLVPAMTGSAALGLVAGKVIADVAFYVCAIFSYEQFRGLVAARHRVEGDNGYGAVDAVTSA